MLIDWFTVVAQALNFLILVWLMKRFLYAPVLAAIAARDKRIADEQAGADAARLGAEAMRADLAQRGAAFDRDRAALLAAAQADAQSERGRLVDAARAAADTLTAQRRDRLAAESSMLDGALRDRAREGVFSIARKALADLASESLEASACELFARRLRALDGTARADLGAALAATNGRAAVRSAFELPAAQRAALGQAVGETFALAATLSYETAPALVCGIELSAAGRKLAWTFEAELAALESGMRDLLAGDAAPVPHPAR
jgi:F-type H+-transporting ATPase subunit b